METAEQKYKNVEKLINGLIEKFMFVHGGNQEDLQSVCNETYVIALNLHDPTKSKFSTWLYNRLWWAMLDNYKQDILRTTRFEDISLDSTEKNDYNHTFLPELYAILTDDAKCICETLLELSPELIQSFKDFGPHVRKTRRALKHLFLDLGWSKRRITRAFKDIKLNLSGGCDVAR